MRKPPTSVILRRATLNADLAASVYYTLVNLAPARRLELLELILRECPSFACCSSVIALKKGQKGELFLAEDPYV